MPRCPRCSRRLAPAARCPGDGARAAARDPIDVAAPAIDGYVIEGLLGVGGFAAVWAAIDRERGAPVALKVARAPGAAAAARFAAEAAALARVGPPATAALLARGVAGDRPWLALERLPGATLATRLERAAAPPAVDEAVAIVDGILACLDAVHAAGLVHGDVAPDNVVVAPDGAVRLLDLGLARRAGERGAGAGTPDYVAPELLRGDRADARADLYAAGALLFELLTLRPPFTGDLAAAHAALRPRRPGDLVPAAAALDDLVLACLAKDPARRPPSAAALRGRLATALRGTVPCTASKGVHTVSYTARAREPALLVYGRGRVAPIAVAELVARHRGVLVDGSARHVLIAIPAVGGADPVDDGVALAERLVEEHGAAVALHLTDVSLRERAGGPPIVSGPDIDRPERWLPGAPWSGVHTTSAAAGALASLPPTAAPPFVGRIAPLAAARRALDTCLAGGTPTLVTIVGEPGIGKTRTLDELAARLGRTAPSVAVQRVVAGAAPVLAEATGAGPTAWLVDDVDRASDAVLDAIEYATMDGASRPVWICVAARPELDERRPTWGGRAGRHLRLTLGGLGDRDALRLAAWALDDEAYLARDALRRLADWAGGNPRALLEVAGALEGAGVIRRDGARLRVDAAAIDALPRAPIATWLAAQALGRLPAALAELARAAALLADRFDRDELDAIDAALDLPGDRVDAGVGLWQLVGAGLLVRDGAGYRFASPIQRAGIAALVDPTRRAAIHRAALAHHHARPGDAAAAAAAHLRLGERALAGFRPVDADRHLGRAIELAADRRVRAAALLGRGRARWYGDRIADAIADLAAARALADALGDDALAAEALLDEAIARDWADDYDGAARAADEAARRAGPAPSPQLRARLALARGRTAWRADDVAAAIPALEDAAARAADAGDGEAHTIALVLLAPALVRAGRLDEAEARFAEVIAACEERGDRLHLCAAYNNRMFLWSAEQRLDRARADLGRARRLARELGYPMPERRATYNLAEDLHWSGDDPDRALALARRARALQLRYVAHPVPHDALLLARVLVDRGDLDGARAELAWIGAHVPRAAQPPPVRLLVRAVALAIAGAPTRAWVRLWCDARLALAGDEALEIAYRWARAARAGGRTAEMREVVSRAVPLVEAFPIWWARFAALTARRTARPRARRRTEGERSTSHTPRPVATARPCR